MKKRSSSSRNSFFVRIQLPEMLPPAAREALSLLIPRLAADLGFLGMEDWSLSLDPRRRSQQVLGVEAEFHDLTRVGTRNREMRVYFAGATAARSFRTRIGAALPELRSFPPRPLIGRDWMKLWRKHFRPQKISAGGRSLHVVPSWRKSPGRGIFLRISPGQAFGTGTHPTTRLCLRLLLQGEAPERVLDFGAGTGILGIAALRCGSRRIVAVESDPVALEQGRRNARLNGARGLRFTRKIPAVGRYGLVFANVLAPVLLSEKRRLQACLAPGGRILVSGILAREARPFLRAFRGRLELEQTLREGDWVAFALKRK